MEFVISFEWLIIGIIACVTVFTLPKIIQINRLTSTKSQKKLQQLDNEYIEELEHQLKKWKNKANQMERGPAVEGNINELSELLPNVISQFSDYAPRWLKPFLNQPDAQKWIAKYAEENPEKVSELFGKLIRKKSDKTQESNAPQISDGL